MVGLGVALPCVFRWILLGTRYVVERDVRLVRMGPYRKRIALRDVTKVDRDRMWNGPILGLGPDFIGIEYGENKAANVSPRDADGLIEAVKQGAGLPMALETTGGRPPTSLRDGGRWGESARQA